ncbi:MAG: histidine ammonia-lyase [Myxococcota bacterium]
MSSPLRISAGALTLPELRRIWRAPTQFVLDEQARRELEAGAEAVRELLASGQVVYGINTGFGLLANTRVDAERLDLLQEKLVLSHSCGVGEPLDPAVVRLIVAMKMASLARGFSGVRIELVEALAALEAHGIEPLIPAQGSVGASGDLAPLAHLAAALIGVGKVRFRGERVDAAEAWRSVDRPPLRLGPKEGLALLNGTQASTALALDGLFRAERLFEAALCAGCLSVEALKGSRTPFDARIHDARGQPGQIDVARMARALLGESEIQHSHASCDKVQDPYSIRCQPQVMGACLDLMRQATRTLLIEANAVTDNPLVFPEDGEALSGGNFHAEPVAFAADMLTNAVCEVGALSERRTAILVDPKMSGLPPFLVEDSGVNSGFMMAQVTAAALVSENRTLAHPASIDSIPTSANQEDHVSMATFGARRSARLAENAARVVAIELLAAAQAVEFHRPLRSSPALEEVLIKVRKAVPAWEADRFFAPDLEEAFFLVRDGVFSELVPELLETS